MYESQSPEQLLRRAMAARSAVARARYARRGLAVRSPIDPETQSMLLRQLYLSHFEQGDFSRAFSIAEQVVALGVLQDVSHQDAARALVALGEIESAIDHLRIAARTAPANRRAFHLWTLGSLLFLAKRYQEAEGVLQRAKRWGTGDRPLYAAHLALVHLALGQSVANLPQIIEDLEEAPCGQGYGRFILGMLCVHAGRAADANRYLTAFVSRTRAGRPALAISLQGELQLAERYLQKPNVN